MIFGIFCLLFAILGTKNLTDLLLLYFASNRVFIIFKLILGIFLLVLKYYHIGGFIVFDFWYSTYVKIILHSYIEAIKLHEY